MSKRKKLRTAGQGTHPPKLPRNPRPGDSDRGSRSSKLGNLQHPNESEDSSTPPTPAELRRQEPGPALSRFPEETAAASFLEQLGKEAALLTPSQTSLRRFVPQFAKPRKTVTRRAKTLEEDPERRAVSLEALPSPSAPWLPEGSLGPDQMPADSPHSEQSGQKPRTPVPGEGTGSCNSEMPSQDPVSEQETSTSDGGNLRSSGPERAQVPDLPSKGKLSCSGAEGRKPAQGAPQEGGAWHGIPEEGDGISSAPVSPPSLATLCMKTFPKTQDLPDPRQTPRGPGGQAECSCGGPACTSLGSAVMESMSTDAPETEQKTPGVAGPDVHPDTRPPASPGRQTLHGCSPLAEEITGDRAEAGPEDKPHSDTPESPEAAWAVVPGNREPTLDAEDPGHPVPDVGPDVDQTQVPDPTARDLSLMTQCGDRQVAESGSQRLEGGGMELRLALCALHPLEHRAATDGPHLEARAQQGSPEVPTDPSGPLQHTLDSVSQAAWSESLAMELDFLPDSQLRDALDASLEQDAPTGNESGLCWPCPSLSASGEDRVPVMEAQPRMEDASDMVRGLILELSNLNRLIMSTHRDLEVCKRLSSRKARKGAGPTSWGEQPWRDL